MWNYVFMFFALLVGTFIGMVAALLFFSIDFKERKPKSSKPTDEKTDDPEEPELPEAPLTRKIPPKDFSVTDFNCAADGVDSDGHISTHQQRQDNAYNALKRRKKK